MAIYSAVPPPPELAGATANTNEQHQQQEHESHQPSNVNATAGPAANVPSGGVDIESWTVSALESLSISPVVARNTGAPLSIPLDEHPSSSAKKPSVVVSVQDPRSKATTTITTTPPARPPSRRDSQRRREALLRGKEGSRQRRRWENDRLLHVPNAQPPEPADWEPLPLHPVTHVPYQVAAYWDLRVRAEVEARRAAVARRQQTHARTLGDSHVAGRVPRELFQRAKKTPAVRTWVRSLEEPVRKYLVEREVAREPSLLLTDSEDDDDNVEDEEIVFVGRNGTTMRDGWKRARRETKGRAAGAGTDEEGMVFDAALGGDDADSAFRRWITHSISEYYGLHSHSVFMGNPKRKVVYVQMKTGHAPPVRADLPRPLWELC
ncbi:R3H-associated N-terminal domain-containing protein [Hypoxylon rubiginosum]|uniref:R3H-associated N-terminal domain-containing protein n=1 Tax=Hypoxylon rubiginosum TaxID=110542 RepID=A0ACC0CVS9_9PEZI|nr:R3H-associated N-terminal domain-containing protein [Hypoxylon rubiginosum]